MKAKSNGSPTTVRRAPLGVREFIRQVQMATHPQCGFAAAYSPLTDTVSIIVFNVVDPGINVTSQLKVAALDSPDVDLEDLVEQVLSGLAGKLMGHMQSVTQALLKTPQAPDVVDVPEPVAKRANNVKRKPRKKTKKV